MKGKIPGLRYGLVVNNIDPTGADMISVRLIPEDNINLKNNELNVNAFPLLPKMLHVKPKVGEGVFVLTATLNDGNSQRYYIGPVISQPHRMYFDPWLMGGDSFQKGGPKDFDVNPYIDDDSSLALPSNDDISIIGRKNCDIHIKNDDIRIQAGVRLTDDDTHYHIVFNPNKSAFIKLKYHEDPLPNDIQSTVSIVGNKINLLSQKSTEVLIGESDENKEELISDETLEKILEEGYKLPYGEKLVALLRKIIKVFSVHTHDFIAAPPNPVFVDELSIASADLLSESNPTLLSDTVRIN